MGLEREDEEWVEPQPPLPPSLPPPNLSDWSPKYSDNVSQRSNAHQRIHSGKGHNSLLNYQLYTYSKNLKKIPFLRPGIVWSCWKSKMITFWYLGKAEEISGFWGKSQGIQCLRSEKWSQLCHSDAQPDQCSVHSGTICTPLKFNAGALGPKKEVTKWKMGKDFSRALQFMSLFRTSWLMNFPDHLYIYNVSVGVKIENTEGQNTALQHSLSCQINHEKYVILINALWGIEIYMSWKLKLLEFQPWIICSIHDVIVTNKTRQFAPMV